MYYAPSTGGFYDPAIHGDAMPDDATPITQDQHADLIAAQAQGARIVAGPEGHPAADWPAPPGIDATRAAARAAMAAWIVEFTSQFTAGLPVAEVARPEVAHAFCDVGRTADVRFGRPETAILARLRRAFDAVTTRAAALGGGSPGRAAPEGGTAPEPAAPGTAG